MNQHEYTVMYRRSDGTEEVVSVPAYSEAQAQYLAPCDVEDVLSVEESVVRKAYL